MDRSTSRLCSSVLIFLTLSACHSKPITDAQDPVKVAQDAKCSEVAARRDNCGFGRDVFMYLTVVAKPTDNKKDKRNPNVMTGVCEFQVTAGEKTDSRPCPDVKMSVSNQDVLGEQGVRSVRVGDKEGVIGGLPRNSYNVTMSSELYKVSAEIKEVPSGSQIKAVLVMPYKLDLPPAPVK